MRAYPKILLLALTLLAGCAAPAAGSAAPEREATPIAIAFTDDLGHNVALPAPPQRVAALNGSYAETWLLAGGTVAGATEDAWSERGLDLPQDTAKLGTVHDPDLESVLALAPELVLLSADMDSHLALDETLTGAGVPHAYFRVDTFTDYLDMLRTCTDLTGRADLYEQEGAALQTRVDAVLTSAQGQTPPRVLYLRAYSTGVKAKGSDSITGAILKDLGAVNLVEEAGSAILEDLQLESILAANPDLIFVTTMGADGQKALDHLQETFQSDPAWASLTAVQEGRYVVLPKDLFHYKPNGRWGESYERLAGILYGTEATTGK